MLTVIRHFWRDRKAELDEAVFVIPVLMLLSFGIVNFGMLGYAAMTASNAANHGARMGSVAQSNALGIAGNQARSVVNGVGVGAYTVSVQGGEAPGSLIRVQVRYQVPNYFAGVASIFGASLPASFQGTARADFRKEGW